jgi:lysophospholipid acyltransferase (LPLAT)-like uncharacterized protein
VRLLCWIVPPLYTVYMWFVHRTSRFEELNTDLGWLLRARYGGAVGVMWHQDVFMLPWFFRGSLGTALASNSDFGDLVAAIFKANKVGVVRGGSSSGPVRRTPVLPTLIQEMKTREGVFYGITCDGSKGPAYRMKKGAVLVAGACAKPLALTRIWARWRIPLPGWDRSYIPLPFNRIVQAAAGPYFPRPDATPEEVEALRQRVENELLELTYLVHQRMGTVPRSLSFGFPEGWQPKWEGEIPVYPFEPEPGHPALLETGYVPGDERARRRQEEAQARSAARLGAPTPT